LVAFGKGLNMKFKRGDFALCSKFDQFDGYGPFVSMEIAPGELLIVEMADQFGSVKFQGKQDWHDERRFLKVGG